MNDNRETGRRPLRRRTRICHPDGEQVGAGSLARSRRPGEEPAARHAGSGCASSLQAERQALDRQVEIGRGKREAQ